MMTRILLAGFGGQGILFAGKQLAATGMEHDMQVSWLPSYGPESRGGTSNCSVIIADEPIGSPIVNTPDILIAMNLPSLDKFESTVASGGTIFVDSSLIERQVCRSDVNVYYLPATQIASDNHLNGFANVIMLGHLISKTALFDTEAFLAHLIGSIPPAKAGLIEKNEKAFRLGCEMQ